MKVLVARSHFPLASFCLAAFGVVVPLQPFDAKALVEGKRPGIVIGIW